MFVEHGFNMKPLTGKLLDADDVSRTGYINILDPKLHVTGPVRRVRRQRVNNNLNTYCPLIRRTDALNHAMASGLDLEAKSLVESCEPTILARAVHYYIQKRRSPPLRLRAKYPARSVPSASWPR
jgi:hypothetical protein